MAHYGHGTGNYLTNFEDYYKSSEKSQDDEEERRWKQISFFIFTTALIRTVTALMFQF